MKRYLTFLAFIVMTITAKAVILSGSCGTNVTFVLNDDGTLVISGSGDMNDYTNIYGHAPAPWSNNTSDILKVQIEDGVTSIGVNAFWDCNVLSSVTIPSSVTSIGAGAFSHCYRLTSPIDIPNSVKSIGNGAFFDSGITSIAIPNSVTEIGAQMFYDCGSLTSVSIGNSVQTIEKEAFYNCGNLTSVTIPNSVMTIGDAAFMGCYRLTSVTLGKSMLRIGTSAFGSCRQLQKLTCLGSSIPSGGFFENAKSGTLYVPESLLSSYQNNYPSSWGQWGTIIGLTEKEAYVDGINYKIVGDDCEADVINHDDYKNLSGEVSIPSTFMFEGKIYTVSRIYDEAFKNCTGITSMIIPSSMRSLIYGAFAGCSNLQELTCFAETVPALSVSGLDGTKYTSGTLYVPESLVEAYKNSSIWGEWGQIIAIIKDMNVVDGENYANIQTLRCEELSFTKTFSASSAGNWNAFYVPMSINVENYAGELDFAEIYAFCAMRDTNWDGVVDANDENFLYVNPVKTGCTKPNVPYMVRPKEAKTYVINSADKKLYAKTNGKVKFSTSHDNFTVTGLNEAFTVTAGDNNYYVSASGALNYRTTGSTTVKANRWVMHREAKEYAGGSNSTSSAKESYRIVAIGEDIDEATAIELIKMQSAGKIASNGVYTLDGRKVNSEKTLPAGIYIKNGKKILNK